MPDEAATRVRQGPVFVRGGTLITPTGASQVVGPDPITVGRDTAATLALHDPEVSAVHCELQATPGGVMLRDLGSTNGTFVGSVMVHEARLTGPCTIRVGGTHLSFLPAQHERQVDAAAESSFGPLVGKSHVMRRLYQMLRRVAPTDLSVLIMGETGSGKELIAQTLHASSARHDQPFVVIDCSAIPPSLSESLLFGHERGSFTGAIQRKVGVFQEGNRGTVFLDELGELPELLQPKLLRVIAERTVRRVGATKDEAVDVRVIAATRRDLRREVNAGRFRSDLFFRVAQAALWLPPLRERKQDIGLLVTRACERIEKTNMAEAVLQRIETRFRHYDWPGNVRELMNVASVLASLDTGDGELPDVLLPLESPSEPPAVPTLDGSFADAKRAFEERYFRQLQEITDGNISEISRKCGLARHQVRAHLRKLGLIPPR